MLENTSFLNLATRGPMGVTRNGAGTFEFDTDANFVAIDAAIEALQGGSSTGAVKLEPTGNQHILGAFGLQVDGLVTLGTGLGIDENALNVIGGSIKCGPLTADGGWPSAVVGYDYCENQLNALNAPSGVGFNYVVGFNNDHGTGYIQSYGIGLVSAITPNAATRNSLIGLALDTETAAEGTQPVAWLLGFSGGVYCNAPVVHTDVAAFQIGGGVVGPGATVTNNMGLDIITIGGGTNNYQIRMANQAPGNYSIYSGTGIVRFGGRFILAAPTVPANAAATGTAGEIAWDAGFVYVCTATNTWKRVAIATW